MKKHRRLVALLLAGLMSVSMLPTSAFADETGAGSAYAEEAEDVFEDIAAPEETGTKAESETETEFETAAETESEAVPETETGTVPFSRPWRARHRAAALNEALPQNSPPAIRRRTPSEGKDTKPTCSVLGSRSMSRRARSGWTSTGTGVSTSRVVFPVGSRRVYETVRLIADSSAGTAGSAPGWDCPGPAPGRPAPR